MPSPIYPVNMANQLGGIGRGTTGGMTRTPADGVNLKQREEMQNLARKNINRTGLASRVDFKLRDLQDLGQLEGRIQPRKWQDRPGTQHGEAAFPPATGNGQQLANPTPQVAVMHALLRAVRAWVETGEAPPPSRYPRLSDGTLVPVDELDMGVDFVVTDRRVTRARTA